MKNSLVLLSSMIVLLACSHGPRRRALMPIHQDVRRPASSVATTMNPPRVVLIGTPEKVHQQIRFFARQGCIVQGVIGEGYGWQYDDKGKRESAPSLDKQFNFSGEWNLVDKSPDRSGTECAVLFPIFVDGDRFGAKIAQDLANSAVIKSYPGVIEILHAESGKMRGALLKSLSFHADSKSELHFNDIDDVCEKHDSKSLWTMAQLMFVDGSYMDESQKPAVQVNCVPSTMKDLMEKPAWCSNNWSGPYVDKDTAKKYADLSAPEFETLLKCWDKKAQFTR